MPQRVDLPLDKVSRYQSRSQQARVLTEAWAAEQLYCVACPQEYLIGYEANHKVDEFHCPRCGARYQLKARAGPFGLRVTGAAYGPLIEAVRTRKVPHYVLLSYDPQTLQVMSVEVLPRHFLTESAVVARRPLGPGARRAGWVGCTISLEKLPSDARIRLLSDGRLRQRDRVRGDFARFAFLDQASGDSQGWLIDVLTCVRSLGQECFTLFDLYGAAGALQVLHPSNRHVKEKIRQQLQVLRNKGIVEFTAPGIYRLLD